ncbi:ly6/PLAUR domain-containing protein 1-like isoform X2 [Tubulanus polymorphus]|uniref:ly6/PLAUR domain-containing protein 1-like isoform X2 n=1 Tax=Tubulanus polymorphus TaxID=672921 RepID=UPI003DA63A8D
MIFLMQANKLLATICLYHLMVESQFVTALKCYQCEAKHHYDCNQPEDEEVCMHPTEDTCISEAVQFTWGRKFSKRCTSASACSVQFKSWMEHGMCTGRIGSMCVSCCNADNCNDKDPTSLYASATPIRQMAYVKFVSVLLTIFAVSL